MRTILRIGLSFVLVLAACTLAAAAEPVILKFHQKEGDKALYSLTATVKSKLTVAGKAVPKAQAKPETATESVRMRCSIEFSRAIGLGRMQVTGRVLDGTVKASSGGHTETQPVEAYTEQYVMTALGDIKSSEITAGEPLFLPFSSTEFGPLDVLVPGELPGKAVKVGDTWSAEQKDTSPDAAALGRMASTSKLIGEATYAGRKCLQIKTSFHGTMQGEEPADGMVNRMVGKAVLTGTIIWLFDPEAGIAVKSDVTGTQTMTAQVEEIGRMSVTSAIEQHVKLVEWNGAPVEAK